jgi:hypothetical protein
MSDFIWDENLREISLFGNFYNWNDPANLKTGESNQVSYLRKGQQVSNGNPCDPDGKYRRGGSWVMAKNEATWRGEQATVFRVGERKAYEGAFRLSANSLVPDTTYVPKSYEQAMTEAFGYGAEANSRLKPDKPDFSPVVSLLELKDAAPYLKGRLSAVKEAVRKQTKRQHMSKAGQYYLALQFGYLPLMKDIISFGEAFRNRHRRFQQLLRDEGRHVRRRALLHVASQSDEVHTQYTSANLPGCTPFLVTPCYGGGDSFQDEKIWKYTKVWCVGRSYYFLPAGPRDMKWTKMMQRRILGGYITPSDLYNLIPFSWMADYFSGLGNFFEAASSQIAERVVFEYAYVMRQVEVGSAKKGTQYVRIAKLNSIPGRAVSSTCETRHVVKTRVRATPLGFGLSKEDLSPFQTSILGALGLSAL